jgi:hypothetical protein
MDNGSGDYLGFLYVILLFIGIIVVFFLLTVLIEAVVLNRLGWDRYRRTLWYSFIANLISIIVMFLIGEQVGATVLGRDFDPRPVSILMNYVIQVVVEVVVLLIIAKRGIAVTVSHTLLANSVSVAILSVLIALLGYFV